MKKIRVKRANVILDVPEDRKSDYMNNGYSVIDEEGNVIEEAMPNDVPTLQRMVESYKKQVAELNEKLKAKTTQRKTKE